MEWLLAPVDPNRVHDVGIAVSWHGRSMVLAWAVIAPLAVIAARYFKVMPGQDWPRELDNQLWWRTHWSGQVAVVILTAIGLVLVVGRAGERGLHGTLGYLVLLLLAAQVGLGVFRGSKGGPTAPAADGSLRGDHYDMTLLRVMFEWLHKLLGYTVLALAAVVVGLGLWEANAARWMWLLIGSWYLLLVAVSVFLQRRGWAVDTYQAIWGPDLSHPGNSRKPIGWGITRYTGEAEARSE
jgi:hypothetical protein